MEFEQLQSASNVCVGGCDSVSDYIEAFGDERIDWSV